MNFYFDMETTGLNPYTVDAKILTAQVLDGFGNEYVLKEWELGEKELIRCLSILFDRINYKDNVRRTYNPVYTYNGAFDFNYLMGRINQVFKNERIHIEELHQIFIMGTKHCDLLQFDNGYYVRLDKLAKEHEIEFECSYRGSDIMALYKSKRFDDIVAHALDDIRVLKRLVVEHRYGDRFTCVPVLRKARYG